jgi:hypothetical protein
VNRKAAVTVLLVAASIGVFLVVFALMNSAVLLLISGAILAVMTMTSLVKVTRTPR